MPGKKRRRQSFLPGCSMKQGYFYSVALLKDYRDVLWAVPRLQCLAFSQHWLHPCCAQWGPRDPQGDRTHRLASKLEKTTWRASQSMVRALRGCRKGPGEIHRAELEQQISSRWEFQVDTSKTWMSTLVLCVNFICQLGRNLWIRLTLSTHTQSCNLLTVWWHINFHSGIIIIRRNLNCSLWSLTHGMGMLSVILSQLGLQMCCDIQVLFKSGCWSKPNLVMHPLLFLFFFSFNISILKVS